MFKSIHATVFAGLVLLGGGRSARCEIPVVELNEIIHPVSASYVVRAIESAEAAGAPVVIIRLNTPGGLVSSMQVIVDKILASRVPVVSFVGPAGAHAASAGFVIAISSDLVAMAPGTNMGAAHPVGGMGKMEDVESKKAASDIAAYVRGKAERRGRDVKMAEQAVLESKSFTDKEALDLKLADLIVKDIPELIAALDGREIKRFDGTKVTLKTKGETIRKVEMDWRQAVLSVLANPAILFLLLMGALAGLGTEIAHPGMIFPGILGVICLILFLFATQIIPINWSGVLLILLAIGMFIAEVKVTSYGLLTIGGIISLILGAMMLVDAPIQEMRVPLKLIIPAAFGVAAWALLIVSLVLRAQRLKVTTGQEGLLGETGIAETDLALTGWVQIHGERWRAEAEEVVRVGESVVVTKVQGLSLKVRKGGV